MSTTEPVPGGLWRWSRAATMWVVAGLVLLLLGLLSGRSDVAVLAAPLLLGATLGWARWPRTDGVGTPPRIEAADQALGQGRLRAHVVLEPSAGADLALLRVSAPGHRPVAFLVAARAREIQVEMSTVRTGRRPVFGLDHRVLGADHLLLTDALAQPSVVMTVLPGTRPLPVMPLPFRLQGLTGPHPSRRAGDGGELYDVAAFAPGDRLRRIDWRVTTRLNHGVPPTTGSDGGGARAAITQLYVRRTFATADATVMLVVDSRDDVGPRVATWGDAIALRESEPSSLDLSRYAAASLAQHYLGLGDRVGLEDLGRLDRPASPAGGRRQLDRLVLRLAVARPAGEPTQRRRVPRLPSGSLIIVFSTFLDDVASHVAAAWRRSGHRVVAVDVLPNLILEDMTVRLHAAYRIVALERADRIADLARAGVETVAWQRVAAEHDPAVELGALARRRVHR